MKLTAAEVQQKIADVSQRSAGGRDLCIYEISTLDDLIPKLDAEKVRKLFVEKPTPIRQLTNKRHFDPWTSEEDLIQTLAAKYISPDVLNI